MPEILDLLDRTEPSMLTAIGQNRFLACLADPRQSHKQPLEAVFRSTLLMLVLSSRLAACRLRSIRCSACTSSCVYHIAAARPAPVGQIQPLGHPHLPETLRRSERFIHPHAILQRINARRLHCPAHDRHKLQTKPRSALLSAAPAPSLKRTPLRGRPYGPLFSGYSRSEAGSSPPLSKQLSGFVFCEIYYSFSMHFLCSFRLPIPLMHSYIVTGKLKVLQYFFTI